MLVSSDIQEPKQLAGYIDIFLLEISNILLTSRYQRRINIERKVTVKQYKILVSSNLSQIWQR